MKGYVVINMPETVITDRVYDTFNTNYLTLVIAMLLSLSMLVLYFIHIHKPINELTKATEEYGKVIFPTALRYTTMMKSDVWRLL